MSRLQNIATWVGEYIKMHPKTLWAVALVFLILLGLAFCSPAKAQQLSINPTSALQSSNVAVSWSGFPAPCVASGAWSGSKATSGSETVNNVAPGATFTLTCGSNDGSARLTWTAPTQNTDGSALTNLAGFTAHYGSSPTTLSQTVQVPGGATARELTIDDLAAGAWYFGVRAINTDQVQSDLSNVASKTIVGNSVTRSVTLRALTKPQPPGSLSVTEKMAHEVDWNWKKARFVLGDRIGTVPLGTECKRDFNIQGTDYYRVERRDVDFSRNRGRTHLVVAKCGQA